MVFCKVFAGGPRRLGQENDVLGQAWTLLGHGLDAFKTAFYLPNFVLWNTRFLEFYMILHRSCCEFICCLTLTPFFYLPSVKHATYDGAFVLIPWPSFGSVRLRASTVHASKRRLGHSGRSGARRAKAIMACTHCGCPSTENEEWQTEWRRTSSQFHERVFSEDRLRCKLVSWQT